VCIAVAGIPDVSLRLLLLWMSSCCSWSLISPAIVCVLIAPICFWHCCFCSSYCVPVIAVVSAANGITAVVGVISVAGVTTVAVVTTDDGVPAIGFTLHTRLKGVAL
jgi:hypothetical protein